MTASGKILILAGTREARLLCEKLAGERRLTTIASFVDAIEQPSRYPVPIRTGGFGGPEGLARTLKTDGISTLIDATHPFAARISENAAKAAAETGIPFARLNRPPWLPSPGECWNEVSDLERAVRALPRDSVVFAALGRNLTRPENCKTLKLRTDVRFVLRVIQPVEFEQDIPGARIIVSRPPHSRAGERRLLEREDATCLLCRNSGGRSGREKLYAATDLKLPIYMLSRPDPPALPLHGVSFSRVDDLVDWITNSFRRTDFDSRQKYRNCREF